jgi:hypothetical protein
VMQREAAEAGRRPRPDDGQAIATPLARTSTRRPEPAAFFIRPFSHRHG